MALFNRFRILSLNLLRQPSPKNVIAIKNAILDTPKDAIQPLFEFIYIPLKSVIDRNDLKCSSDLDIHVMECLRALMSVGVSDISADIRMLLDSLSHFLMRRTTSQCSEEWHSAFVDLLAEVMTHLTEEQMGIIYQKENVLVLSHFLFYLVQLLENPNQNLKSKVATLQCLSALIIIDKGWPDQLIMTKGDLLSSALPGIATALFRIISSGDVKSQRRLKQTSLNSLEHLLVAVFSDDFLRRSEVVRTKSPQVTADGDKKVPLSTRDEAWLAEAAQRLRALFVGDSQLLRVMLQRTPSDGWRVKLAAIRLCQEVLDKCTKSLAPLRPALFECLLCLSEDDYPAVSSASTKTLLSFKASPKCTGEINKLCINITIDFTTSFSSLIHVIEDSEKLPPLRMLRAAISLLPVGQMRLSVMTDARLVRQLTTGLALLLTLDSSEIALLEEVHYKDAADADSSGADDGLFQKHFVHFRDEMVFEQLSAICRLFGERGDMSVLLTTCEALIFEETVSKVSVLLVSRFLLEGYARESPNSEEKIVCIRPFFTECLLSRDLLESPLSIWESESPIENSDQRPRQVKQNILTVCVVMECLSAIAKLHAAAGQQELFLLHGLFPVLALLAARCPALVVHAAQRCLHAVAAACAHPGPADLLLANADYLLDGLSRRLRRLDRYPDSPRVLTAILEQGSDPRLLPLLSDSVEEMLLQLDEVYEERCCLFLPAFVALMAAVRRWYCTPSTSPRDVQTLADRPSILDETLTYLREQRRHRQMARQEFEECEDDQKKVEDVEEEKEVVAPHQKLVESVVKRCGHLLSADSSQLRLLSLHAIREGCRTLADCETVLLPLVHSLWPTVLLRFRDQDPIVVLAAFQLLTTLADVSGDFIRSRTTTDLIGKMTEFLRNQATHSFKVKSPVYKFSAAFKIQRQLLHDVGRFGVAINLQSEPLERLVTSILPYLSCFQPSQLRQACLESVNVLYRHDPGLVWYKLHLLNPTLMRTHAVEDQSHIIEKSDFDDSISAFLKRNNF